MNEPLVSVLMTAYNREKYIGAAIQSVLTSTFNDFELIIVDDCSTDRTVGIARSFEQKDTRIKVYVNEKNLGDYPNRNMAASHAKGKYLKYLDADDYLYSWGLQVLVDMMERFPEAGLGLGTVPDDNAPFPILVEPRDFYMEGFFKYNHFDRAPGSLLIKRFVFQDVGGFSGKRMVGDFEFLFKISRYYKIVKLPIDTYWNRIHSEQESQTEYAKKNYLRLRGEIVKEALAHPDCPLTNEDVFTVKKHLYKNRMKNKMIGALAALVKIVRPRN